MFSCCFLPFKRHFSKQHRDMTLFFSYDKFQNPSNLASGWLLCVWARCEITRRFEVLNLWSKGGSSPQPITIMKITFFKANQWEGNRLLLRTKTYFEFIWKDGQQQAAADSRQIKTLWKRLFHLKYSYVIYVMLTDLTSRSAPKNSNGDVYVQIHYKKPKVLRARF